jgi:hypothetical protein
LALDLHHIVEVSGGGGNTVANLLALCPTCHALYTRGSIRRESIYAWKSMLVSLSRAFDLQTIDNLLFLNKTQDADLQISGDGVLNFGRLISAGLAAFELKMRNGPLLLYRVHLTKTGEQLVSAWQKGDLQSLEASLGKCES